MSSREIMAGLCENNIQSITITKIFCATTLMEQTISSREIIAGSCESNI